MRPVAARGGSVAAEPSRPEEIAEPGPAEHRPDGIAWQGIAGDDGPDRVEAELREAVSVAVSCLAADPRPDTVALAEHLYDHWYARHRAAVHVPPGFPTSLVEVLRTADVRAAAWEDGWMCDRVHVDGRVIARHGHEVRMLDRCDHLHATRPGADVRSGDELLVAGRRERVDPSDAWWRAAACHWRFTRPPDRLVRLFCHLDVAALPLLVEEVTSRLDALVDGPAWQLKIAVDPALHVRADATVLYLDTDRLAGAVDTVTAIIEALERHGRASAPPLSRRVARGFAVAVDPGGDESFGSHRCRLLAEALEDWDCGDSTEVALTRIARRFEADGIDPEHPERRRTDVELPWP